MTLFHGCKRKIARDRERWIHNEFFGVIKGCTHARKNRMPKGNVGGVAMMMMMRNN